MTIKYVLAGVLLSVVCVVAKGDARTAAVAVNGSTLNVHVADTYMQRNIGLAKFASPSDIGADGLLFTFDDEAARAFWMKGMAFPIDIVWIANGKVVKVNEDVAPPKKGEAPISIDSQPLVVDMVLELPAGGVAKAGIVVGSSVTVSLDGTVVIW